MLSNYLLYIFGIIVLCIYYTNAQTNSTIDLPTIKKCVCKASEVESREGCTSKSPLYIQIWNSSRSDVDIKDISSLPFIVEELICPNNSVLENFFDPVFISEDGKFMQYPENNTDQYCIEYVINDEGKVFQRSQKCVLKHSVHLCCEIDEYMDSSSRCTKFPTSYMIITAMEWFNKFDYITNNIYCNETVKLHKTVSLDFSLPHLNDMLRSYDDMTHGKFCLGMYGDENELYPGITFCSSETDFTDIYVPKLRYCCDENEAFHFDTLNCIPNEESFHFPFNIEWPSNGVRSSISTIDCLYPSVLTLDNDTMYQFYPNGSMYTESGKMIDHDNFCLGMIIYKNQTYHSGFMCLPEVEEKEQHCPWRWNIYRICLGISSFFLVLTLIVYLGVADLRKRISGVCLISELTALLVSQITLIILQTRQRDLSAPGCLAAGVIEIIFILASFFWLNIMCYDVWSTFRVFRPFSEKVFHPKLFLKYSLYAWGIPVLVGILALIFQLADVTLLKPNFTPDIKCFFRSKDWALQWFYLYGIILILLLINFGFFVHLAFTLMANQMESRKHLKRKGGHPTDKDDPHIENLKLHGKLFIVMGLPWVIEAFTSFAGPESECYIWFLDLFNMLRGFLIFIVFVCKKSTKNKLIAAWCPSYKGDQERTSSSRKISTTTLSLSNWLPSIQGRKISKVSLTSGGNINLEALKEEVNEAIEEEEGGKS